MGALVEAHGPAGHPFGGLTDPLRRLAQVGFGDTRRLRDLLGRIVCQEIRHRLPALGELGDERFIRLAHLDEKMEQTVHQREIGAGLHLKEQVRLVRRGVAAWIDDDQLRARLHPVHHPQEQDRVAVGHVGADYEEQIGLVEVLIRTRRAIGPDRQLVAAARARHAQARIALDIIGADEALAQLVGEILRFQRHLAGDVERHGIRPVPVNDRAQTLRRARDRFGHGDRALVPASGDPGISFIGAAVRRDRHVATAALGAKTSEVGGMGLIARHLDDLVVRYLDDDAAADTAIGAYALDGPLGHAGLPETKKAPPTSNPKWGRSMAPLPDV